MRDNRQPNQEFIVQFVDNCYNEYPFFGRAYNAALQLIQHFETNDCFENIFIKVNFINGAFKTGIGDTMQVAKNISGIQNIDNRILQNDYSLIGEIAIYVSSNGKPFNFYSFATKYCHCHKPNNFPIYDNFVKKSLVSYRDIFEEFPRFANGDLRDYQNFVRIVTQFKNFAQANALNFSTIDRFLWFQSKPE